MRPNEHWYTFPINSGNQTNRNNLPVEINVDSLSYIFRFDSDIGQHRWHFCASCLLDIKRCSNAMNNEVDDILYMYFKDHAVFNLNTAHVFLSSIIHAVK